MDNNANTQYDSLTSAILGILIAIIGMFGIGMTRQFANGELLIGAIGTIISISSAIMVTYLIYEAWKEGQK